jgi:hypothetical protein
MWMFKTHDVGGLDIRSLLYRRFVGQTVCVQRRVELDVERLAVVSGHGVVVLHLVEQRGRWLWSLWTRASGRRWFASVHDPDPGLTYVLNYHIITDDGPVLAFTVTYLLPVVAVLAGLLLLHEPVTASLMIGVAVVLLGVVPTSKAVKVACPAHAEGRSSNGIIIGRPTGPRTSMAERPDPSLRRSSQPVRGVRLAS